MNMRVTLSLPEGLLARVRETLKERKASPAVRRALESFLEQAEREDLIRMAGKVDIADASGELERLEIEEHPTRHVRRR